jgi:hypothetical protein
MNNFLNKTILKKYRILLIHLVQSFVIPFIISFIVFFNQGYFGITVKVKLYEIFWCLTCSTQILSVPFIFYFPILVIFTISLRLLLFILFVYIHSKIKKIGGFFGIIFAIVNIVIGMPILVALGKI